jgi:hypothetical protein
MLKLLFVLIFIYCANSQYSVTGAVSGMRPPMYQKLQLIANTLRGNIQVYSGCRGKNMTNIDEIKSNNVTVKAACHRQCNAADFGIAGYTFIRGFETLKQHQQMLRGTYVIYHAPGRRPCSTGEHLHICNGGIPNYPTGFCYETTCQC